MNDKQFDIQFHTDNPFAERLKSGMFTCLLEIDTPRADQPFVPATGIGKNLARCAHRHDFIHGLAITDRHKSEATHNSIEVGQALQDLTPKPLLVHVSGKGSNNERVRKLLGNAHPNGIRSILAVTGDRSDLHPQPRANGKPPPHPVGYHESVDTIREARALGHPLFVGCAVNPFKYNPADQYLQYYKLVRKLAAGADFVTAQAGWDMRKYQEIKWFLQMRELEVPILARLVLLNRDKIKRIHRGLIPGAHVSRSFAAQLQRESDISDAQCLAAQLRRLALQVTGCRLLGFSGVQIAGIDNEQTLDMVVKAIQKNPDGITEYPDWVEAWQDFHADIDFTPASTAYYMFENLLNLENVAYAPNSCRLTEQRFPKSTWIDRLRFRTQNLITKKNRIANTLERLRKQRGNNKEHSGDTHAPTAKPVPEHTLHLHPHSCPKRLLYGACGGSQPDGVCEFGHDTCFFHRVLALANDLGMLDRLEEINPHE